MVLQCDATKLSHVLQQVGHNELLFSPREWALLNELCNILTPFQEATNMTQGENVVTISFVVPSVLALNHHLETLKQAGHLKGLAKALQMSLKRRFQGIFINVQMETNTDGTPAPFSDPVYLKAAALDPAFSLQWVQPHLMVPEYVKEEVAENVKGKTMVQCLSIIM